MNAQARFPVAAPPARFGIVRGLPHTYEMQAFTGRPVSNNPAGRWNRGQLYRGLQPVAAPAFAGPAALGTHQYDPTVPGGWVTQRS